MRRGSATPLDARRGPRRPPPGPPPGTVARAKPALGAEHPAVGGLVSGHARLLRQAPSGVADPRRIAASSVVGGPQRTGSTPRAASSLRPCAARVSTTPQAGDAMKLDSFTTVWRFKDSSPDRRFLARQESPIRATCGTTPGRVSGAPAAGRLAHGVEIEVETALA